MNFKEISSITLLANYLRCKTEFIEKAINEDYFIFDENETTNISAGGSIIIGRIYKKKKGKTSGFRIVYHIYTLQLSNALKILNNNLNNIFLPNKHIHGFVNGKSIKTNASEHLGKKYVMSLDIENFFESITDNMVSIALQNLGFQKAIADYISKVTTINGRLVQGFNTSPTLANIVTNDMDIQIADLCGSSVTYTRYADDLYFSSDYFLPGIDEIEFIINSFGFKLNRSKSKVMKRGQNQYVTGLTVYDSDKPRIPKKIKRNLRLEIYYLKKFGYIMHAKRRLLNEGCDLTGDLFKQKVEQEIINIQFRLFGWSHYIHSIEPAVGKKMYMNLSKAKRNILDAN